MARLSNEAMRARLETAISANGAQGEYQALVTAMSDLSPMDILSAAKRAQAEGWLELMVVAQPEGKARLEYRAVGTVQ